MFIVIESKSKRNKEVIPSVHLVINNLQFTACQWRHSVSRQVSSPLQATGRLTDNWTARIRSLLMWYLRWPILTQASAAAPPAACPSSICRFKIFLLKINLQRSVTKNDNLPDEIRQTGGVIWCLFLFFFCLFFFLNFLMNRSCFACQRNVC